ncbi:hypothetical protein AAVH_25736 [Aphelenchoides avenae]|nr:hypothetical protein AAVH_25736 [Aphelenchus avenae]
MESPADKVPTKRQDVEGHEKTQIPQETMLEVLRWLDRFDLDGKQITSRRLRSLVENNQMPLRKVSNVFYSGQYGEPRLQIFLNFGDHGRPTAELTCETDAGVQKAAAYLSSCFVRHFRVEDYKRTLPRNAVIAAPPLIHDLEIRGCDFDKGEEDTLSATLTGSTFQGLSLVVNSIPAWQIDDKRLESLRRRGCSEIWLFNRLHGDESKYEVTEEGILNYCFTSDDDLPVPSGRRLGINCSTITPVFFKKLVEASKNSRLTCDVELRLQHLRFDVSNLDVGVLPSRCQEAHEQHVRYNFADHGNGRRLLMHFESWDGVKWEAVEEDDDEEEEEDDEVEEDEDDHEEEEEDDEED